MIQLRMIREYVPRGQKVSKRFDKPFSPDITVESFREIVERKEELLKNIPEAERYNVFYTLGHVPGDTPEDRKKRQWSWQEIIPFDIDGINVPDDENIDPNYTVAVSEALKVNPKKITILFSGNGLQVCIRLKKPIDNPKYFDKTQRHYIALCSRINDKLREYNLQGEADSSAFAPNRLFRLPLTLNKKPGKPERIARLLTEGVEPIDYDITKMSGLPEIEETEQMTEQALSYLAIDTPAVLDGCDFLKHTKEHADNITEPEWYAALSILARLENGKELSHEFSKGHDSYYAPETDRKIEQSLEASGPRTCDNINKLWGKCRECPNYKKQNSPITLKSENFIATSHSGFHAMGQRGNLIPQYEDLRRHYEKETGYINAEDQHYTWNGTHYEPVKEVMLDNYAQEHFDPKPKNVMVSEFRGLIKRTNLETQDFFLNNSRKINLSNGVYCIDTMELEPHNPQYGFRYVLPFDYDPHAKAPTFEQHLSDITCGDPELQSILLEYMGYALSNDFPYAQKILILTGKGRNGKSTFLKILRALAPIEAQAQLTARGLGNDFNRQMLDGALFNVMEEVPSFTNKNFWEDMKDLSGGTKIFAAKKFKDPYLFNCTAKFIMTCNELPKGANPNYGYYRRLLILPFKATFSGSDDNRFIGEKIVAEELSGVFNMALAAYYRLRDNDYRFTKSKIVDEMLQSHQLDNDTVKRWAVENVAAGDGTLGTGPDWAVRNGAGEPCMDVAVAYQDYVNDTRSNGENPVRKTTFSKRLLEHLRTSTSGQNWETRQMKRNGKNIQVIPRVGYFSDAEY